jgi:hypothetical protein
VSVRAKNLLVPSAITPATPTLAMPIPIGNKGELPGAWLGPVTRRAGVGELDVLDGGVLDDDGGVVVVGALTVELAIVSAWATVHALVIVFSTVNLVPDVGTVNAKVPVDVAFAVTLVGDPVSVMDTGAGVDGIVKFPAKVSSIVVGDPLVTVIGMTNESGSVLSLNCTPSSTRFFGTVTASSRLFSDTEEPVVTAVGVLAPSSVTVKGTVPATGIFGHESVKLGVLAYACPPSATSSPVAVRLAASAAAPVRVINDLVRFICLLPFHETHNCYMQILYMFPAFPHRVKGPQCRWWMRRLGRYW